MANDELLRLTGSAGNPEQTITATGSGTGVFAGKNKTFHAVVRIGGDVSGTTPTLDLRIQQSDVLGSGYATLATFPQAIDEQVKYVATTTPRYEVPRDEDPLVLTFTTTKNYVRADWTVGGTATPTFNDVSVELVPLHVAAFKRSGAA